MTDTIISVENLGKCYQLTHEKERSYTALRDVITQGVKGAFSKQQNKKQIEDFWALKDISFEINKGDAVGIIGRNGAGKSTLLKLLSRITEPTKGRIILNGRVASLLEVGTGFHPELSGRENIYLNGSILGMTRKEIKSKFDEIVDFSGVEKFLDTPVKRYSSGMYVRLAFAVAAHLEPEILVVDEVLAVGDAEFQKKCLGKMNEVSKQDGRTVIFVSHQLSAITQLCTKSLLLFKGSLIKQGNTREVIDHYLESGNSQFEIIDRPDDFEGRHFKKIYMTDIDLNVKMDYRYDEEIFVKVVVVIPDYRNSLELAMRVIDRNKKGVFTIHHPLKEFYDGNDSIKLLVRIPGKFLTPGKYSWVMSINDPGFLYYDLQDDVLAFSVLETGSEFARYEGLDYGCVFANYSIDKL